jgi:large subunit ribosomal protein L24
MSKAKLKIKKGDKVVILAGRDKGQKGEVLKVLREESRVVVQGINMVTKHSKPTQVSPAVRSARSSQSIFPTLQSLTPRAARQRASVSRR